MWRLILILLLGTLSLGAPAQTLHLILVSDVEDKTFGPTSLQDEEHLIGIAQSTSSFLSYKLNSVFLNRAGFTGQAVRNQLSTLATQPNDIILFWYSGLGFYPSTSSSPFPTFRLKDAQQQALSLDEVGSILETKNVRLGMALADCRSGLPLDVPGNNGLFTTVDIRKLIVQKLFLTPCGVVKLASARKGEIAVISASGSAFMSSLSEAFRKMLEHTTINTLQEVSIDTLFARTQGDVKGLLNGALPAGQGVQTLIWNLKPCPEQIRARIAPTPSFKGIPNETDLITWLDSLVTVVDKPKRQRIIQGIRGLMQANATLMLGRQTSKQAQDPLHEPTPAKVGVEPYLLQLANHNPKVIGFRLGHDEAKRSNDFRKFVSVSLIEIIKDE
jgi:hypothetical protein